MDLTGNRIINADRQTVWEALNDAEVLKACIPGCSELNGNTVDGFEAVITQKVGPVKATFKGKVTLTDIVEATSYRIVGEGTGGVAGYAKGGANVVLADVDDGTELTYEVDAKIGGKLAQLGSRVVKGVTIKLADKFFDNFENAVSPQSDEDPETDEEKPKKGWFWKKKKDD